MSTAKPRHPQGRRPHEQNSARTGLAPPAPDPADARPAPHIQPGARYQLSAVPLLLAQGCHPKAAELERRHDHWIATRYPFSSAHARARFLFHRSALWTAATYPTTDEDRFHDLSRLTSFLFAFDDLCGDHTDTGLQHVRAVLNDCLGVMHDHEPATPHGTALADIWTDMSTRMPPRQRRRLTDAVVDFSRGCFTEIASRAHRVVLDFDNYVWVRLQQSLAAWIYFILTEYAAAVDLDDDVLDHLRPLHWACAEHLLYANDLFSFRAEHFADDHVNALCILTIEGATLQQAIDHITKLVTQKERQVAAGIARILNSSSRAHADVRTYLKKLEYVISGNHSQARFAPRYHGTHTYIDHPIEKGTITLWPDHTELHRHTGPS
jgi:hypothetical protein